ncbi:4a-hydroxytetrahydrobiopterin dehydratase [Paenibacillus sp. SYP-B3998]|uniref:4a-hydroxytetrahydrobiopterin dehydratase n=1 Tax=Paenibacillus sp. SYP-B3998 TaxID=2678564 RepID=A0A6G4A147_9BACL|nr:4a-hydroxytetrahydrobiopterin dehydratase [Paenibacillus sp. SYP-B3998]NEW07551.1 4a-hydroxytetrahydrobiopterin dehydratase [Paenibacillus sp. SYP-B3998]
MRLSVTEIDESLGQAAVAGWTTDDHKWIVRKYRFAEFLQGIHFVNEVARFAEASNHHPLIAIDYKMVTLRLTSWHAGGLTALDFSTAAHFELAYSRCTARQ